MKKYTNFFGAILIVVGFSQLVWAMDFDNGPKNKELVRLQQLIDEHDLKAIKQHIEQAGLQNHLNDTYTCFTKQHPQHRWLWVYEYELDYQGNGNQPIPEVRCPLSYVLKRYQDDELGALQATYLKIARYFVDECKVDSKKALRYSSQKYLQTAVKSMDVEAVQLFVAMGMLQLPQVKHYMTKEEINLVTLTNDQIGKIKTGTEKSKKLQTILAILEGRYVPENVVTLTTHAKIAVAILAIVTSVVVIKKVYDWYYTAQANDETDDADAHDENKAAVIDG